jgi:hypothetical protein
MIGWGKHTARAFVRVDPGRRLFDFSILIWRFKAGDKAPAYRTNCPSIKPFTAPQNAAEQAGDKGQG